MPTGAESVLKGGCRCGAIRYSSSTLPTSIANCHCQTCRKLSGAPFLSFASFPRSSITWTSGASSMKKTRYSERSERAHCPQCGSPLYMWYEVEPEELGIAAGSIDESSVKGVLPKVDHHIFVEERAGWCQHWVEDGLPKYEGFPPGFQPDASQLDNPARSD